MSDPTPPDAKPAKAAGNSKLPLIIGMVVAAAVAGGGAYTFAMKEADKKVKLAQAGKVEGDGKAKPKKAAGEGEEPEDEGDEDEPAGEAPSHTVNLPPFLVNLGPDFSEMHYLKVSIGVEVANEEAAKVFEEHGAKVRNNVLMYLSTLKADEITGPEARVKILSRLRSEVKKAVGAKKVQGVYLTEFVIQ